MRKPIRGLSILTLLLLCVGLTSCTVLQRRSAGIIVGAAGIAGVALGAITLHGSCCEGTNCAPCAPGQPAPTRAEGWVILSGGAALIVTGAVLLLYDAFKK